MLMENTNQLFSGNPPTSSELCAMSCLYALNITVYIPVICEAVRLYEISVAHITPGQFFHEQVMYAFCVFPHEYVDVQVIQFYINGMIRESRSDFKRRLNRGTNFPLLAFHLNPIKFVKKNTKWQKCSLYKHIAVNSVCLSAINAAGIYV